MIYAGVGFEPQTLHLLHSEGGSRGSNLEHSIYSLYDTIITISDKKN
jgi:hypothetical protein